MKYTHHYISPLGEILIAADDLGLTGLWFVGQKFCALGLDEHSAEADLPVFQDTCHWLDIYFSGQEPDFLPGLHLQGTVFQETVWRILLSIPYGKTLTYGQIASQMGLRQSAQAVGGAVGRNPISIIVPCHRVVGAKGQLTGYAGGIERKAALLDLESGK